MADETRPYDPQKDATAQEPLTPNEAKLVTRLFGDPFAFPMEFKAWLRGWLEEQFPRIASLAISAETGAAGSFVPPAGAILDFGGSTAPGGYVLCDGAEYDKTSLVYQRLFNAIGYAYGTGSTGNMFRVPDFQGRVAVMKGQVAEVDSMGESEGLPVSSRSVWHNHSASASAVGDHTHGVMVTADTKGGNELEVAFLNPFARDATWVTDPAGAHTHTVNVGPGGGRPNEGPAYLVINKIISLGA